ncbi:MAG: nicotinate-nucleotide--dimethylbenzimidazole phosphoribosyltransferase [Nannocystaceae bacterium]
MNFHEILSKIEAVASDVGEATQRALDNKTKPRKSLGRLEELACQVAAISRHPRPPIPDKTIVVMGADHGVAEEGVSAYPQEVTGQMLLNFAGGGAAINVLARHAGAQVVVVDMGTKHPVAPAPEIRVHRIGAGTKNFTHGPAMTRDQAIAGIEVGITLVAELSASGVGLLGIGDMGIGNTTAASALTSVLCQARVEEVTGHGTGISDDARGRKVETIRRGLARNTPDPSDPIDVLAKLGGFEIAGLCGVTLAGAAHRIPVVMDGFVASVAALVAVRIKPEVAGYLIASHRSVEAGHLAVLRAVGQAPLFDLELRLGEGTGAALAMQLVEGALRILHEMATFASAQVSNTGA